MLYVKNDSFHIATITPGQLTELSHHSIAEQLVIGDVFNADHIPIRRQGHDRV